MMPNNSDPFEYIDENTKLLPEHEIRLPKMYRVIIHNDHYTTMDFVVEVLVSIFHKPAAEATMLMMDVHKKGRGIVGAYTLDIAMTKITQVHTLASLRGFPLKCSYEEA
jgi:ATP-dependent Clp protease adaptor protein ClpS